jgi:hypothetical protein
MGAAKRTSAWKISRRERLTTRRSLMPNSPSLLLCTVLCSSFGLLEARGTRSTALGARSLSGLRVPDPLPRVRRPRRFRRRSAHYHDLGRAQDPDHPVFRRHRADGPGQLGRRQSGPAGDADGGWAADGAAGRPRAPGPGGSHVHTAPRTMIDPAATALALDTCSSAVIRLP